MKITNEQDRILRKWAKLRHHDKKFLDAAFRLFNSLEPYEKERMIKECSDYIQGVESGIIEPSIPKMPIRIIKQKQLK